MTAVNRGGKMSSTNGYRESQQVQIKNLERNAQELWQKHDALVNQVAASRTPNFQVIISAASVGLFVIGAIFGLAIGPITQDIEEGKRNDRRFQEEVKKDYVRSELYIREIQSLTAQISMIRQQLIATRAELATREQLLEIAKRADETSKIIGGLYPLDKVIANIQNRIDQLSAPTPTVVVPPRPSNSTPP